jgi:hypothetical protein
MNRSKELYERAYYGGEKLTPSEENQLGSRWGVLYAKNVVHRRLRGVQVNEAIENSEYRDDYEAYRTVITTAFDELLTEANPTMYEDKIDDEEMEGSDVPIGSLLSSKASLVRDLIDQLEDKFKCHPSEINTPEDFQRLSSSGPEMKKFIIVSLEKPECCQHSADRLRNSIETSEDGNDILQKLYLNGNEWF